MRSIRLLTLGAFSCAIAVSSCGGGSGSSGGSGSNSVTAPSVALTVADVAPALGEGVATAINAALQTGTARADDGPIARLLQFFVPTLQAQSNFAANCSRGGNVNIRYTGFRPVVMTGTEAVFSNCGVSSRGQDVNFSGTLNLNGYWTAQQPGPVVLSGSVTVTQTGGTPITFEGSVLSQTFNGRIGGITVGTPDTAPPPSPNTCPARLGATLVPVTAGGGTVTFSILEIGATCPWSVTSAPSWVTVTTGGGRGQGTVAFTVAANPGAFRSGTLVVNNMNVTINQSAGGTVTPPPTTTDAAVGRWTGTATVPPVCSISNKAIQVTWNGTLTRSGNTYTFEFTDNFFEATQRVQFAVGSNFSFTIADSFDRFVFTGQFSGDSQRMSGAVEATIDCVTSKQTTKGTWEGRRTGP